jgi:TatA/E family protein of Tat protein translocase
MSLFLFGVSMGEVVLIFLVVLMLFGSKTIPDLARSIGKGMNEFRKATDDIKREFEQSTSELKQELTELESNVRQNSNEIRDLAQDAYREDYGTNPNVVEDVYGLDKPVIKSESIETPDAGADIKNDNLTLEDDSKENKSNSAL